MDTYILPPRAETEREPPPGEIENKPERSAAEIRALIADIIADGMGILMSAGYAPRCLIREGERLEESAQSAPGNEPSRNLWQAVRNWVRSIIQWFAGGDETNGQPAPDMERRLEVLERRVDALADEMRAEFGRVHQRLDESAAAAKAMGEQLSQRLDESIAATKAMGKQLNRRLDLLNASTTHERAKVVEDSLRNWAVSHHRWREILPLAREKAKIEVEILWSDHMHSRYWKHLRDDLGLPMDSAVGSCDLLAEVHIQFPNAPVTFLFVGEASVNMDSGRIRKTIQHARELEMHTSYRALPCVCATTYTAPMVDMARTAGVMALQWQPRTNARIIALPDDIKTFLGWPASQK